MYRDPLLLRCNVVKLRFSREEDALLEALANYSGQQKAVLVRELVLDQARALLLQESGGGRLSAEGPGQGQARA